jgi:hypothetical protein
MQHTLVKVVGVGDLLDVRVYKQTHHCPLTYSYVCTEKVVENCVKEQVQNVVEDSDTLTLHEDVYLAISKTCRHEEDLVPDSTEDADDELADDGEEGETVIAFTRRGRAVIMPQRFRLGTYL